MTGKSTELVRCSCGEAMDSGYLTALGLLGGNPPRGGSKLVFVLPGEQTSANPIQAFKQGLEKAQSNNAYLLKGYRCPVCGRVKLIAQDQIPWTP